MPFRSVNRAGAADHEPGLQRHHLLPRALLASPALARFFAALDPLRLGFDDFRRNGLLLPAHDLAARRLRLPLHRGPHRLYNAVVGERVGMIEAQWSRRTLHAERAEHDSALFRIALLQRALRRRLLAGAGTSLALNRRDPALHDDAFRDLDAMADLLWSDTAALSRPP